MKVERMIAGLRELDREELARLDEALRLRLREVVEYRPCAGGYLQAEIRRYVRKDGGAKEQGPYWYFRYHEDGRQKKLYLGRTDDPEGELAKKRTASTGGTY